MVIKKYMMMEGNKILAQRNEVRDLTQKWIAMAFVVKICKTIDHRRKIIHEKYHRIRLEDKMARRLQGFFLRIMYHKSLTIRQRSSKNYRKIIADSKFKLSEEFAEANMRKLNRVREQINNRLVQRSIVFSSRMFGHTLAGMRKIKVGQAHMIVIDYIMKYCTF